MERNLSRRHVSLRLKGDESAGYPDPESRVGPTQKPEQSAPGIRESVAGYLGLAAKIAVVATILVGIVVVAVVLSTANKKDKSGQKNGDGAPPIDEGGSGGIVDDPITLPRTPVSPGKKLSPPAAAKSPPPPAKDLTKYQTALNMALDYYNAQKSGKLSEGDAPSWRGDTYVDDADGKDLSGGYFDAGDGIKVTLPMAYSMTMIAWAVIQYPKAFVASGGLDHAKENLRWGTDWLLKTWIPNKAGETEFIVLVGDSKSDHACWARPEDRDDLKRSAFSGGVGATDALMEVVAALAAASEVFKADDPDYSTQLLKRAEEMWAAGMAAPTKGVASKVVPELEGIYTGSAFTDDIYWASTWLYKVTKKDKYLAAVTPSQAPEEKPDLYISWDNKKIIYRILYLTLGGPAASGLRDSFISDLDANFCQYLPGSSTATTSRTTGGLLFLAEWGANQYAGGSAFAASVYADVLDAAKLDLPCGNDVFKTKDLRAYAKSQVDYILGANPAKMSYIVGFGKSYPKQIHHRGASIPTTASTKGLCGTKAGIIQAEKWLKSTDPNPNVVYGAVSGGPAKDDSYVDVRTNFQMGEPALSTNAPCLAAIASVA